MATAVVTPAATRPARSYRPSARLHRPGEFAAVLASAQRLRRGCFELRYRRNEVGGARLGLVFPKRLARRAVLRNLLKRLARESFRAVSGGLPAVDAVLRLVKPPFSPLPSALPGSSTARADRRQRAAWRCDIDELLADLRS